MLSIPSITEAEKLIEEKLGGWFDVVISHIPNFIVAVIIAIIFSFIARLAGKGMKNVLRRSLDSTQIADLMASIFKVIVLSVGVFIALDFMGLKSTVTSLLAGAGIVGLAIGFAFQDMTENLIAGIAMGIRKPFKAGDVIETDNVFGSVHSINLRNTLIESFYGQLILVPNKILFRNVLRNYSTLGVRRIEVPVGISYADDIEKASEVIVDKINQFDFVIRKNETAVYAEGFGDSSINLLVWFWIKYPGEPDFMTVRHKGVVAVKQALDAADISIPFPIRTLDFGIKGGEKLDAMISDKINLQSANKEGDNNTDASQGE
ncbi:mechanosensitive ion channel family protein [Pseudoalteromonas sp. SCSIO 43095]|uniref:mechanosensitive ion channel family protein n=1 Tax=unclassified Pseudoalteromonas TaxID=194690 RepID=UPI000452C124|nr:MULTISPECIES: mechanosensitive ion channel family protein [unclassified Pseudoalteromonas]MDX1361521.1 mechanosensitive ion channel family protein [Pseudoalteromonas tetraodonis]EWS99427.1 mechanosensitive ion channel protein [Pseudoalteromonas sp. SCSIO_11900]MCK8102773.1 mechanosensitive ion channel family protein [Pseudoalteromonas sp. 2CM36K]MDX1728096.1 mechanosensitive ion channel family protein [Pseudoalteromonas tetraodonis]TMO25983.1 mechanosensitive ion channel family protein [Pse